MPWSDEEVRREYHRQYYEKNKQKWVNARAAWSDERRRAAIASNREYQLRRNYGLSANEYAAMLKDQGGACKVCKMPPKNSSLHVDHCHSSGRVRGLLCVKCNMALGVFEKYREQIIEYLEP